MALALTSRQKDLGQRCAIWMIVVAVLMVYLTGKGKGTLNTNFDTKMGKLAVCVKDDTWRKL